MKWNSLTTKHCLLVEKETKITAEEVKYALSSKSVNNPPESLEITSAGYGVSEKKRLLEVLIKYAQWYKPMSFYHSLDKLSIGTEKKLQEQKLSIKDSHYIKAELTSFIKNRLMHVPSEPQATNLKAKVDVYIPVDCEWNIVESIFETWLGYQTRLLTF